MVRTTASTRQPPAGGPRATLGSGELLRELRRGDRDAFVRYYRLFRAPVHHFACLELGDEQAAAAATSEALVAAFRRAILGEGGDDLAVLTYGCALAACEARAGGGDEPRRRRRARPGDLRRRFDAALEALEPRRRAALLLHDVAQLDAARSALVLGLGEEAAAALLFHAREQFRAGLPQPDGLSPRSVCRQAEDAAARAVGLGLEEDELSRLRHHAVYCKACRRTTKEWASAGSGLKLVLAEPELPRALAATPVFGDPAAQAVRAAVRRGSAGGLLARGGRVVRSRAAAWAVTAACLAVATGVVAHGVGVEPQVVVRSVGPAIRLIVPNDGAEPAVARSADRDTRSSAAAIGVSGVQGSRTRSAPPAAASPGATTSGASPAPRDAGDQPAAAREDGLPATGDAGGVKDRDGAGEVKAGAKADRREAKASEKAAQKEAKKSEKAARKEAKAGSKAERKEAEKSAKADRKAAKARAGKAHSKAKKKDD